MIAVLIVLDSVGIGSAPDAAEYGDTGASTLSHLAAAAGGLHVPTMQAMGLAPGADLARLRFQPTLAQALEGAQFVIKNPTATSTCGCGSSFSV